MKMRRRKILGFVTCSRWRTVKKEQNMGWNENGGNGMEFMKKTVVQAIICLLLLCMIWGGYFLIKTYHVDRNFEIV